MDKLSPAPLAQLLNYSKTRYGSQFSKYMKTIGGNTMRIRETLISIQKTFDRYMAAATYAQADAHDLALQILEEQKRPRKSIRPVVRQRPRMQLRTPK